MQEVDLSKGGQVKFFLHDGSCVTMACAVLEAHLAEIIRKASHGAHFVTVLTAADHPNNKDGH